MNRIKIQLLASMVALIVFPVTAMAYNQEAAISNLASEFATCTTYYLLTSGQMERQGKDATALKQSGAFAYSLAESLSNQKVTEARIELAVDDMLNEIDRNWSNGAILISKYGKSCKQALENPDARLQYWLDKK